MVVGGSGWLQESLCGCVGSGWLWEGPGGYRRVREVAGWSGWLREGLGGCGRVQVVTGGSGVTYDFIFYSVLRIKIPTFDQNIFAKLKPSSKIL